MPPTPPAGDALERFVSHGMLQFDGTHYRMLASISHALRRKVVSDERALERLDAYLAALPLGQLWERRLSWRAGLREAAPYLQHAWVRAWKRGHATAARALLERAYAMNELSGQQEPNRALADEVIETATPAEHASLILARANLTRPTWRASSARPSTGRARLSTCGRRPSRGATAPGSAATTTRRTCRPWMPTRPRHRRSGCGWQSRGITTTRSAVMARRRIGWRRSRAPSH